MVTRAQDPSGYKAEVPVEAPGQSAFDAVTTAEGMPGWWSTSTSGSAEPGGKLVVGFDPNKVVLEIERLDPPESVVWKIVSHTGEPEWPGTRLRFDVKETGANSSVVVFQHLGLTMQLHCYDYCERAWDHFMTSLAAYASGKDGSPYAG